MSCAGGNNTKTLITSVAAAAGQLALHVHICIATSVHYELGRFSLGVLDATLTAIHAPQSLKTKASLPFKLHSAGFFPPSFIFKSSSRTLAFGKGIASAKIAEETPQNQLPFPCWNVLTGLWRAIDPPFWSECDLFPRVNLRALKLKKKEKSVFGRRKDENYWQAIQTTWAAPFLQLADTKDVDPKHTKKCKSGRGGVEAEATVGLREGALWWPYWQGSSLAPAFIKLSVEAKMRKFSFQWEVKLNSSEREEEDGDG